MLLTALLLLQAVDPHDVAGVWATENGRAQVEITETSDGSIRGEIIWYASYVEDPDERAAERETGEVLGSTLLRDYERAGDMWRRGRIFDLKSGSDYRSAVRRVDEDTLAVEGCLALFCRTQNWQRVPESEIRRIGQS